MALFEKEDSNHITRIFNIYHNTGARYELHIYNSQTMLNLNKSTPNKM
jgi:hypothetical protein